MGWSKGKAIARLKGIEVGKTAVVMGNGPSVLRYRPVDDGRTIQIGMNASLLLRGSEEFPNLNFHYYVFSDTRFFDVPEKREIARATASLGIPIIVRREVLSVWPEGRDCANPVRSLGRDGFIFDLTRGYYFGCTTTMLAIQLAYYLGCTRILLTGVDLRYDRQQPRFYQEKEYQPPDHFTSVQIWNIANAYHQLMQRNVELRLHDSSSNLHPYVPF